MRDLCNVRAAGKDEIENHLNRLQTEVQELAGAALALYTEGSNAAKEAVQERAAALDVALHRSGQLMLWSPTPEHHTDLNSWAREQLLPVCRGMGGVATFPPSYKVDKGHMKRMTYMVDTETCLVKLQWWLDKRHDGQHG